MAKKKKKTTAASGARCRNLSPEDQAIFDCIVECLEGTKFTAETPQGREILIMLNPEEKQEKEKKTKRRSPKTR